MQHAVHADRPQQGTGKRHPGRSNPPRASPPRTPVDQTLRARRPACPKCLQYGDPGGARADLGYDLGDDAVRVLLDLAADLSDCRCPSAGGGLFRGRPASTPGCEPRQCLDLRTTTAPPQPGRNARAAREDADPSINSNDNTSWITHVSLLNCVTFRRSAGPPSITSSSCEYRSQVSTGSSPGRPARRTDPSRPPQMPMALR
jgi:hypothetical protein